MKIQFTMFHNKFRSAQITNLKFRTLLLELKTEIQHTINFKLYGALKYHEKNKMVIFAF